MSTETGLKSDQIFWPYPHPPYDIQIQFMQAMKVTLDNGHCGIFESPTGTGKTSSIICSVVPWILSNWDRKTLTSSKSPAQNNSSQPSWVLEHERETQKGKLNLLNRLRQRRDERYLKNETRKELIHESGSKRSKRVSAKTDWFSSSNESESDDDDDDDEEAIERREEIEEQADRRKLYFCSRTHTQLSQFLAELKRVYPNREITAVQLGSRTQLCVNEEVRSKNKGEKLNDACLDMQDGSSGRKCQYLENPNVVMHLSDAQLYEIRDVEDLLSAAKSKCGCAYYSAREAAKSAMVIALPYAALLSQNTREALGIDLEGHVVVCDEAHNLIDAVTEAHTSQISLDQLNNAHSEIKNYQEKYAARFNLDNMIFLSELASVIAKLISFLTQKSVPATVFELEPFLDSARLGDNNLFGLVNRAKDAQLNKKLKGVARELNRENTAILPVISFLERLTSSAEDGRVNVTPNQGLKFLLLNPGSVFAKIVEKAHSVILTGGTMHPVEDVVQQLFTTKDGEKRIVDLFSCGHVVPKDNLRVLQSGIGPSKRELKLTFDTRNDFGLMDEIGNCIRNICSVTPDGVVVFLPSYTFQDQLLARWESTKFATTLKKSLVRESREAVFRAKEKSDDVSETTFAEYERLLNENPHGCVLVAVVGGKLSEGINFSDHLARCVVMVGMPYPNKNEPELAARMAYVENRYGAGAGTRFFEDKCWKAVNQSIGRSIRHRNDFACVVFLDVRYSQSQEKLPGWIGGRFEKCSDWGQIMSGLSHFFRSKPKRILTLKTAT